VLAASIIGAIALIMEAARKPEYSHLHTIRRENLKSHLALSLINVG
jgi:hypothetical protein